MPNGLILFAYTAIPSQRLLSNLGQLQKILRSVSLIDRELSAFLLGGLVNVCERDGISVTDILAAGGANLATVQSPSGRILRSQAVASLYALSQVSPDPHAAFRAGIDMPLEKSVELVRLFSTAPDMQSLIGPLNAALGDVCGGLINLSFEAGVARLSLCFTTWNIKLEEPFHEAAAGGLISALRLRFGSTWKPSRVLVGHRRSKPKLSMCDGIEIVRGAPDNAAVMSIEDATSKPRPDHLRASSRSGVEAIAQDNFTLVDQIQQVIIGRLSLALDSNLDDVASVFGTSSRSLKRHIALEKTKFSSIVEEVKIKEAKRLLADTDIPITEIADILGYRHLPSFTRAFSRSTGNPPSEFRKTTELGQK